MPQPLSRQIAEERFREIRRLCPKARRPGAPRGAVSGSGPRGRWRRLGAQGRRLNEPTAAPLKLAAAIGSTDAITAPPPLRRASPCPGHPTQADLPDLW